MKVSLLVLSCVVVTSSLTNVNAFVSSSTKWTQSTTTRVTQQTTSSRKQRPLVAPRGLASTTNSNNDNVEALLAAAAKARADADRLAAELGKPTSTAATTAAAAEPRKSMDEVQRIIPDILAQTDPVQQAQSWQKLRESQSLRYFGSANLKSFPVSLSMLEQRTGLTPTNLGLDDSNVNLDDFKYATIYVLAFSAISGVASLALLPPNIGATLCYVFAVLPVLFLGIGSTAPGLIADVIAKMRNGSGSSTVSERERRIRHEAAHFCCGYWCGLSVDGYSVLDDDRVPRVEFRVGTPPYSNNQIAALAVTALAGLVAEAKEYSNAMGARQDLLVLENDVFRKSQDFLGAAVQQDLTRWGAFTAALLLQQHKPKYEKVVEAFSRNAKIEECITILESE